MNTSKSPIMHRNIAPNQREGKLSVLVAEDDEVIRRILQMSLKRDGYHVITVDNGQAALDYFRVTPTDLVILDINMPEMDGYAVCNELRKWTDVPIIMVTTNSQTDDIISGYQKGADTYITKPFSPKELLARVGGLLRRIEMERTNQPQNILKAVDLELNDDTHEVFVRGQETSLSPNEFDLLRYFLMKPNITATKEDLLASVWGYNNDEDANLVRVTVRRLRSKIELNPSKPAYIRTVRGVGYVFVVPESSPPGQPVADDVEVLPL